MIEIRLAEAAGVHVARRARRSDIFSERFLIRRPLLQALDRATGRPPVLLIDELDRTDEPFEAYLLEVLSDFQVTIPETRHHRARRQPPIVVITSNRTREIHDAIKRRCLYHWVDYPDAERELAILAPQVPARAGAAGARDRRASCSGCARMDLFKPPGIAETHRLGARRWSRSTASRSIRRRSTTRWACCSSTRTTSRAFAGAEASADAPELSSAA